MTNEAALTKDKIEDVLKGISIPSPPQIIADLQMEMASSEPDINEISNLISKDPSLAGSVLKTVNSPYYGDRGIDSISKAVMLLGKDTISNIVNTVYLRDSLILQQDISDEVINAMSIFWDSAIDVARACRFVAQRIHFSDSNMAYMLGLFHNAGIPLLMLRYSDYLCVVAQSYHMEEPNTVDAENKCFKTNHAEVSSYAARTWKLPEILCRVIEKHHNVTEIFSDNDETNPDEKYFLAILKLGEYLAVHTKLMNEHNNDLEWQQVGDQILEYLSLDKLDYEDLLEYTVDNGIGG